MDIEQRMHTLRTLASQVEGYASGAALTSDEHGILITAAIELKRYEGLLEELAAARRLLHRLGIVPV